MISLPQCSGLPAVPMVSSNEKKKQDDQQRISTPPDNPIPRSISEGVQTWLDASGEAVTPWHQATLLAMVGPPFTHKDNPEP